MTKGPGKAPPNAAAAASEKRLDGTKVDENACRACSSKRMIRHHSESREEVFRAVIKAAQARIRTAEQEFGLGHPRVRDALERLIRFTGSCCLETSEFIRLAGSANLRRTRYLCGARAVGETSQRFPAMAGALLEQRVRESAFFPHTGPLQLTLTIASSGCRVPAHPRRPHAPNRIPRRSTGKPR